MSKDKYQEAFSNYFTAKLQFDNEMYKSMELLEELVDKATPKKPAGYHTDYNCPTCNKRVRSGKGSSSRIKDKVCRNCYQVLDWSE